MTEALPDAIHQSAGRKVDRDEVFVEDTKSICPVCKVVLDAQVNIRDGKVYLRKRCREHGWFEVLVHGNAQEYCLGIIEVNTNCNLDCPICFADSGHQPDGYAITLEQCERMLDVFVASEGEAEVMMFSGKEPIGCSSCG